MYSFDPFSTRCLRISTSSAPNNTTGRGSETKMAADKMKKGGRDNGRGREARRARKKERGKEEGRGEERRKEEERKTKRKGGQA